MIDRRRRLRASITVLAFVLASCSPAPAGSPTPGASQPGGSPSTSSSPSASGPAADVLAELAAMNGDPGTLDDVEATLAPAAVDAAGLSASFGGPDMLAAIDELRRTATNEAMTKVTGGTGTSASDPLAGQLADAGSNVPLRTALSGLDFSGDLVATTIFTDALMQNPPSNQGSSSSGTSTSSRQVTAGGRTANVTVQSTLTFVSNGSVITGNANVTTTIAYLDANGNVVETTTITSNGVVEVDRCPADDGSVNGDYRLDYAVTSTTGSSATYNVAGRVVGQVLDDAFLHGFTLDASAAVTSSTGANRAVTMQGSMPLGTAGSITSVQVGSATGQVVRADPNATTADITQLYRLASSPAFLIAALMFDHAQTQWRHGACVAVDVQPGSKDVNPNAQFQPFVVIRDKVNGGIIRGLPVKGTMTGGKTFTPADVDKVTPYAFTYEATGHLGDVGKIHWISTSRRGIGELDVEYTVATHLVLELGIDSTIDFTMYHALPTNAKAHVTGKIRLARDASTGLWAGNGFLSSTTTSGAPGCNYISITGSGNRYDWVVKDVKAEPGMRTSDIEVWMDAGTAVESFDHYTATYCPPGLVLTGTVNTWENILFVTESKNYFGRNGFRVGNFDAQGVATDTWYDGLVLGTIGWQLNCDDIPPVVLPSGFQVPPGGVPGLAGTTKCIGNTYYTLKVIDPGP